LHPVAAHSLSFAVCSGLCVQEDAARVVRAHASEPIAASVAGSGILQVLMTWLLADVDDPGSTTVYEAEHSMGHWHPQASGAARAHHGTRARRDPGMARATAAWALGPPHSTPPRPAAIWDSGHRRKLRRPAAARRVPGQRHAIISEKRPQKGGEAANCALGARYLCPKWPDLH
jgi:hypothetical protein